MATTTSLPFPPFYQINNNNLNHKIYNPFIAYNSSTPYPSLLFHSRINRRILPHNNLPNQSSYYYINQSNNPSSYSYPYHFSYNNHDNHNNHNNHNNNQEERKKEEESSQSIVESNQTVRRDENENNYSEEDQEDGEDEDGEFEYSLEMNSEWVERLSNTMKRLKKKKKKSY